MTAKTIPVRNARRLADDQTETRLYEAIREADEPGPLRLALEAVLDELHDGGADSAWTPEQLHAVLAEVLL